LNLPLNLAWHAKRAQSECDVLWAGNEHIGMALSFLRVRKPLVVVTHYMESPLKRWIGQLSGVVRQWDGIGFHAQQGRQFFIDTFQVPAERLFQFDSAKYLVRAAPATSTDGGPIVSAGTAKRDYGTLLAALRELPECTTEIYGYSRYGSALRRDLPRQLPANVRAMGWADDTTLVPAYQRAPFIVVPLQRTRQNGAGMTATLEASALGKAVIATRTGGMTSFVNDGETGILVPPRDVSALRDAIRLLWSDPAACRRMGEAGRQFVAERFHPDVIDRNIIAFLDNLKEAAATR